MIGCSVVKRVGRLDAGFQVRRTTDHAPENETCLSTVEETGGQEKPISDGYRNKICWDIVSSSRTVSLPNMIGLPQVLASAGVPHGLSHLILVIELLISQEERSRTEFTTL